MAACPACGSAAGNARFCAHCGHRLDVAAAAPSEALRLSHSRGRGTAAKAKAKKKKKKDREREESGERQPRMEVPPAAGGDEASAIYKRMLAAVRGANRDNDEVVAGFKRDCKAYGQGELKAALFVARLETYFGSGIMLEHMLPQLAQLIPDDKKRKKLLKAHLKRQASGSASGAGSARQSQSQRLHRPESTPAVLTSAAGENPPVRARSSGNRRPYSSNDMMARDSVGSSDSQSSSGAPRATMSDSSLSSRLTRGRYADTPKCSICSEDFDIKNRRHHCRKCGAAVCKSCSPARMLISPEQISSSHSKNYDPAIPQRVCTICTPILQAFQSGLNVQYANCHKENPHEAKTRFHLPYSGSLEKECRNAADILGNFFRPDFGADSDRYIPVTFLKKAKGIAFLTVIKAGLLITAKAGTGIVISKLDDGTWSAPSAIGTAGIGGGFEAGGELIEFMIIMGSTNAVKVFHRTQVNVGGGLSLALGPYGRDALAQAAASRGGFNANFSYSHSRGLFAGISLHGAVITARTEMNTNFYGQKLTPEVILSGQVPRPRAAQCLYDAIDNAMEGVAQYDARPPPQSHCNACRCDVFVAKAFSRKCKTCGHDHSK